MKHDMLTSLVALSATALATVSLAQDPQSRQDQQGQQAQQDRSLQQQQRDQAEQIPTQGQAQRSPTQQSQGQAQQRSQQQQAQQGQGQQNQARQNYETGASVILSGTVASLGDEKFQLDYGQEQEVTVDLNEWDWSGQLEERLSEGQQVTVSGTIDENWTERRAINADNIYVTTDYTYYYIVDENPAYTAQQSQRETQEDGTFLSTRGEVKQVSGKNITLESQGNIIEVDTSELAYDPLDEEGVQQIKQGDRIYVFGDIDDNFFENKTMSAEALISLRQEGQGRMNQGSQRDVRQPGQQQKSQGSQRPGQQQGQQGAQPQSQQGTPQNQQQGN